MATSRIILKHIVKMMKRETEQTEDLTPHKWSWLEKKFAETWKLTERHIKAAMNTERVNIFLVFYLYFTFSRFHFLFNNYFYFIAKYSESIRTYKSIRY
jgi:hypothetical protein